MTVFDKKLASWKRDWKLMSLFFSGREIAEITARLRDLKIQNLAYCSFESRFARSGGLSSVTMNILPFLKETTGIPRVFLITPYYPALMKKRDVGFSGKEFYVPFMNRSVKVRLYEFDHDYSRPSRGSLKEYYIRAEGFFETERKTGDPYTYSTGSTDENNAILLQNALFYCRCVPYVLKAVDASENTVCHLNEWQTALVSLTAKEAMVNGTIHSCGTVQTIHNSYDSPLSTSMLAKLLDRARRKKAAGITTDFLTVYQVGIQLIDAPLTTVSEHFAEDLTSDIIQTRHYAPHLQGILATHPAVGINNGMFVDFAKEFPRRENHTVAEIRRIKTQCRKRLLRVLSSYRPPERFGDLTYRSGSILKLPDNVPVIVMSGRLDPVQKGYFTLLRAIEKFGPDEIKAVLTPMAVRREDLDYFYEVACKCRGNLTVFPIRMDRGYNELQTGATFGIMPSIYEPFGAAIEYMAGGTVVIGRATGGLVDQIDPGCGFLFREDPLFHTTSNVKKFVETADIIQARKKNPWAQSMADNLYSVLRKAIKMYRNDTERYYTLIINGFRKAGMFTWEESAARYHRVYRMINRHN
jgi:glycogen synthase